jgi:hypothetical protein
MDNDNDKIIVSEESLNIKDLYSNAKENHPIAYFFILLIGSFTLISLFALNISNQDNISKPTVKIDEPTPRKVTKGDIPYGPNKENIYAINKRLIKISQEYNNPEVKRDIFNHQLSTINSNKSSDYLAQEASLIVDINRIRTLNIISILKNYNSYNSKLEYTKKYINSLELISSKSEDTIKNLTNNISTSKAELKKAKSEEYSHKKYIRNIDKNYNTKKIETTIAKMSELSQRISLLDQKIKTSTTILKSIRKERKLLLARLQGASQNKDALAHEVKVNIIKDMDLDIYEGRVQSKKSKPKYISQLSTSNTHQTYQHIKNNSLGKESMSENILSSKSISSSIMKGFVRNL